MNRELSKKNLIEMNALKSNQMTVVLLKKVMDYYRQQGIRFILNGEATVGYIDPKVAALSNSVSKYAYFLANYFYFNKNSLAQYYQLNESVDISPVNNQELFSALCSILHSEISELKKTCGIFKNQILDYLSDKIFQILSQPEHSEIKEKLEEKIAITIFHYKDSMIGLPPNEALEEMKQICKDLKEGEYVGYMFTGRIIVSGHFQAFILSKFGIISPIGWGIRIDKLIVNGFGYEAPVFDNYSDRTYDLPIREYALHPQGDRSSCGYLGMLTLKKLLKNNAAILKISTLCFSYYKKTHDGKIKQEHLFVPSSHTIHYSQSRNYISALNKFVMEDHTFVIEHKFFPESEIQVITLRELLENSLAIARKKNDVKIVEENKMILDQLPHFRETWNRVFLEYEKKHEAMLSNSGRVSLHLHLRANTLLYKSMPVLELLQLIAEKTDERDRNELISSIFSVYVPKKIDEVSKCLSSTAEKDEPVKKLLLKPLSSDGTNAQLIFLDLFREYFESKDHFESCRLQILNFANTVSKIEDHAELSSLCTTIRALPDAAPEFAVLKQKVAALFYKTDIYAEREFAALKQIWNIALRFCEKKSSVVQLIIEVEQYHKDQSERRFSTNDIKCEGATELVGFLRILATLDKTKISSALHTIEETLSHDEKKYFKSEVCFFLFKEEQKNDLKNYFERAQLLILDILDDKIVKSASKALY